MRLGVVAVLLLVSASPALGVPADCSKGPIPDGPVKGMVKGKAFEPTDIHLTLTRNGYGQDGVHFDAYALNVDAGSIFNEFAVTMLTPAGKPIDGRTYIVLPTEEIGAQRMAAPGLPDVQGWDMEFEPADVNTNFGLDIGSMRVEWGARKGDQIAGKLHFCSTAIETEIGGSFTATLR